VADTAFHTLSDAAAAAAAAGAGDSKAAHWPTTCSFANPYSSPQHFMQECQLLQDLPALVLNLAGPGEYQQCYVKRRKEIGEGPFESKHHPFLRAGSGGAAPSSSSSSSSQQPEGSRPGWELVVDVAKLRTRVWEWSLHASQAMRNIYSKSKAAGAAAQMG
jgi:hypothetical protein